MIKAILSIGSNVTPINFNVIKGNQRMRDKKSKLRTQQSTDAKFTQHSNSSNAAICLNDYVVVSYVYAWLLSTLLSHQKYRYAK